MNADRIEVLLSPTPSLALAPDLSYLINLSTNEGEPVGTLAVAGADGSVSTYYVRATNRVSAATVRKFLAPTNGQDATAPKFSYELVYALTRQGGLIHRCLLPGRQALPSLRFTAREEVENIANIVFSDDGRYVAASGDFGDTDAQHVQVWNLDMQQPYPVFECTLVAPGKIASMCFNRSNQLLYASLTSGELYVFKLKEKEAAAIESESVRWRCRTIANNPENKCVAFGGDGPLIWFLDCPVKTDNPVDLRLLPFQMSLGTSFTGLQYLYMPDLPYSQPSCWDSGRDNRRIDLLKFLNGNELLIVGNGAAQIVNISANDGFRVIESRLLPEKHTLVAAGNDTTKVTLILAEA